MKTSRILLIEPDVILAKVYRNLLVDQGYDVYCASDAQSAIRLLDHYPFDLIVLELQLVDHGGAEFIYELRSYSEWSTLPVLLHTIVPDHATNLTNSQLRQLGVVGYLYKPTTPSRQLLHTIEAALLITA